MKDKKLKGYIQHQARNHMDKDLARYLFVSVIGEHESMFGGNTRQNVGKPYASLNVFVHQSMVVSL